MDTDTSLTTALIFFLPLVFFFFRFYFTRPSKPKTPSPQTYPVLGNLIGFLRNRHRFFDWVSDLLSATPSLTIRAGGFLGLFTVICTADPRNLDHLLRSNFSNYVKGSRFSSNLEDFLGHGIFNVDGDLWTVQRKIASHEFNTRSLRHLISNTVQSLLSTRLIPLLSSACDNDAIVDLKDVFRRFAFDNVCNVAFGVDPQWLLADGKTGGGDSLNSAFVQAFDCAVMASSQRLLAPIPAVWKLKKLLDIGSEKRLRQAVAVINDYAMNIIKSKEKEEKCPDHKQDLLFRFMHSTSNFGFSNEDERRKFLRDIVVSFILAGKDATSTALTWFFWVIAGHPRCERLIYEEVAAAGEPGNLGLDELKKLHYLHAALSETLRLFPPVPMNSRLTVTDDVLPDGTEVKKGWFADYSAYAMGRMQSLWGPDCREFKPERWLNEEGVFQPSDQFKFAVFHGGPRVCLGRDMAYLQMKCVAAAVIYEFEVEAVDGGATAERMMEPPYTVSILLEMRGGLRVRLKRRRAF